jgi:hypothetical protein
MARCVGEPPKRVFFDVIAHLFATRKPLVLITLSPERCPTTQCVRVPILTSTQGVGNVSGATRESTVHDSRAESKREEVDKGMKTLIKTILVAVPALVIAATVGLAGCGDDSTDNDLSVVQHDQAVQQDMAKKD